MTKKHFIALADMLKDWEHAVGEHRMWEQLRDRLADFCASQNPRFDRALWLDYIAGKCGPNGGKVVA
jgi:hypothetical protein